MNDPVSPPTAESSTREGQASWAASPRRTYEAPRIVKKRAVSRATLFTGSGPDSGGVFGSNG